MILPLILLMFAAGQIAAGDVGPRWEFDRDGENGGWEIESDLEELDVRGGRLTAIVAGDKARIAGPDMNIAAEDFGFVVIRMRIRRTSSAILWWDSDDSPVGFYNFQVEGDGQFHEYEIPVHTSTGWQGTITRLRGITFFTSLPGTGLNIDYIRVVRLGVRLDIEKFRVKRIVPLPGEPVPVELIVRNNGDAGGTGRVRLALSSGIELIDGEMEQAVGPIAETALDTLRWVVTARDVGDFHLGAETGTEGSTRDSSIVLTTVAERWQQKEFLLTAWSPPFVWASARERSLGYYGEANFATLLWTPPSVAAVDSVASYNMRCLVNVGSIVADHTLLRADNHKVPPKLTPQHFAKLDEIIDKFLGNPAVVGYSITDEPDHRAFANLGEIVAHIRRRDPTRMSYVNQHPSSAGEGWFGPRTYRELLEHHLDVIKLELLSYDRYTFFRDRDGPDFFHDLAIVRQVALDYDVPFANIVQAVGDEANLGLNWRIPNEAEHRWLAYNSLAYGARSLMWFHWNSEWGVTGSVARDRLFASIKAVNAEVNALGPYMMLLRSVGAYHVGEIPRGAVALLDTGLVTSVISAADMAVGLFKDESGNDYFMIVNDYEKPVRASVTLERATESLLTLDVESQRVVPVPAKAGSDGTSFEADFRPGGGRLFFFAEHVTEVKGAYGPPTPSSFALRQNYPNPFNPTTTIAYDLAEPGAVTLKVYDALGQLAAVLVDEHQKAGSYTVRWTAEAAASGVYAYVLEIGGQALRRKMVLLK